MKHIGLEDRSDCIARSIFRWTILILSQVLGVIEYPDIAGHFILICVVAVAISILLDSTRDFHPNHLFPEN